MRGNHHIIGRASSYVEPEPISAADLALVKTVTLEPAHSRLVFWAVKDGERLGQVGTFIAGQVYRVKENEPLTYCAWDWNKSEPPHARAILALLNEMNLAQSKG